MNNEIIKVNTQLAISTNKDAMEKIITEHREIIKLALAPKIQNMPALDCQGQMIDIFRDAATVSGQMFDEDSGIYAAGETHDWMLRLYPEVTIEEIRAAVRAGVYGEYGEYFGLNPKTYVFFVTRYLTSEKRRLAKTAFEAAKNKTPAEPVKMTIGDYKSWILEDYRIFKEMGKEFVPFISRKYVLLRRLGLIGLKSRESWNIWLFRSKNEKVWRETQGAKKKGDKGALNEIYKIYSNFEENKELPVSEYKRIVNNARRMRYFRFFELMAEKGIDNFFTDQNINP